MWIYHYRRREEQFAELLGKKQFWFTEKMDLALNIGTFER